MNQIHIYCPVIGPFDPCPPIREKMYVTPPDLFMGFQPMNLTQFNPYEALKWGTLWSAFYSPYEGKKC
ncbi:MAG: cotJA1 [Bacilli bacterium]|nr:cotJA1 [Bacilli bacterium]